MVTRAAQRAAFHVPDEAYALGGVRCDASTLQAFWQRLERRRLPEEKLVFHYLSPMQLAEAKRTGWIPVIGSSGGRWLVALYPERMHMFKLQGADDDLHAIHKCLVFQDGMMPSLDWAVSKVLLLEANEGKVNRTAL